jgi:hypothetical protein
MWRGDCMTLPQVLSSPEFALAVKNTLLFQHRSEVMAGSAPANIVEGPSLIDIAISSR